MKSSVSSLHLPFSSVQFRLCFRHSCLSRTFSSKDLIRISLEEILKISVRTESFPFPAENHAQQPCLDWTSFCSDFPPSMSRCKYESERRKLQNFHFLSGKFPNGLALVSRSCGNSGEASLPRSALSPASDASRAVARSSRADSRLLLLESRTINVASLLTSIGALGSQPVRGDCSANRPTNLKGTVVRRKSTCSVKLQ